jgi:hypothetical protein
MRGVMPPLRVSAKLWAAFAPLNAAEVERYPLGPGAMVFSAAALCSPVAGASGGLKALHHNNGMHPTADTLLLIFLQSLGAAGDAGR